MRYRERKRVFVWALGILKYVGIISTQKTGHEVSNEVGEDDVESCEPAQSLCTGLPQSIFRIHSVARHEGGNMHEKQPSKVREEREGCTKRKKLLKAARFCLYAFNFDFLNVFFLKQAPGRRMLSSQQLDAYRNYAQSSFIQVRLPTILWAFSTRREIRRGSRVMKESS